MEKLSKDLRCFLHKKPQKNCKKCQRALELAALEEASKESAGTSDDTAAASSKKQADNAAETRGSGFKCSPMLKEQICNSKYFKNLAAMTAIDSIVNEILENVDCIDVYHPGTYKVSCSVSSRNHPTSFICHVAHLCDLPRSNVQNELDLLIDNREHAMVRCVGLLYLRFVTPFADLVQVFDEYLLDDMELCYNQSGKAITTTIGEYAESLLMQDKYFDSPLPRLPVKVKTLVEEKVAPLIQYRKRMAANRNTLTRDNIKDMPVEVYINGEWYKGVANGFANRHPSRVKVKVSLDSGADVNVDLGKVIINDRGDNDPHIGGRRDRSRSRGRGHKRDTSPDWSRTKGKSDHDLLQELRERVRSQAASGQSVNYVKKTSDASMAQPLGARTARKGNRYEDEEDEEALGQARLERKRQEEQERQRQLASVYQKYCSTTASRKPDSAYNEVETTDTLRLG